MVVPFGYTNGYNICDCSRWSNWRMKWDGSRQLDRRLLLVRGRKDEFLLNMRLIAITRTRNYLAYTGRDGASPFRDNLGTLSLDFFSSSDR